MDDVPVGDIDNGDDGLGLNTTWGEGYRTCSECGGDCLPEPAGTDEHGVRFVFVCPEHGVQSIVDPFEGQR